MIVFLFDENGRFIGSYDCPPNPFLPGEFLLPAGEYLTLDPGAIGEHQAAVVNDDKTGWELIPDFVGITYWLADGSEHLITEIGIAPPEGSFLNRDDIPPTFEQNLSALSAIVQKRLDDFARTRNYDSCLSCCTYRGSSIPNFADEADYMFEKRDHHWSMGYQILAAVQAGQREIPSEQQLFIELGPLEWPN